MIVVHVRIEEVVQFWRWVAGMHESAVPHASGERSTLVGGFEKTDSRMSVAGLLTYWLILYLKNDHTHMPQFVRSV
jgi:hypothetical protein